MEMKKNIIVGQSGGPTAVINGSLYGVITESLNRDENIEKVYGMINGIEGFLKGNVMDLGKELSETDLELLKTTPAAYLGSCRFKLPEDLSDPVYPELFEKFKELNISYFLYIGGNDSMDTVSKLSRYADSTGSSVKILGIPKTIDNDLVMTDHTPGFGSAAKFVASMTREISVDASIYDKSSVTIVEIMGRHAGWLTAASVLARQFEGDNPVLIYLPEVAFDENEFLSQVEKALVKRQNLVVCVSEGIHDKEGTFICEYSQSVTTDSFGHKNLAGCGKYLEDLVKDKLGVKARSVELNVCQRCSSASLSSTDLNEAIKAGAFGVTSAINGETGKMIAFKRNTSEDYSISCTLADVNEICNQEKEVPGEWIINNGSDIGKEFIEYALPLIQGSVSVPMKDGLPHFLYR